MKSQESGVSMRRRIFSSKLISRFVTPSAKLLLSVLEVDVQFKLNQVGLSKNVLRALDASSDDIPALEAFPKSHIVTFKYYLGVICFLEENYTEVCCTHCPTSLYMVLTR